MLASSPRLIASLAVAALLPCSPAVAAPAVMTNTNDAGPGSLRAALATAGNGDVLAVPAGTYLLTTGALKVPAGDAQACLPDDASGRRRHRLALRLMLRLRTADDKLTAVAHGRLTMKAHR